MRYNSISGFRRGGALLWLLVVLLSTPLARAEDAASIETARRHFREGIAFYDQGDFEKARLAFLETYKLKPHPAVLLNLAQSELQANRTADAANHFAQYLREPGGKNAGDAQEGLRAASSKVGRLNISVSEEGATVSVSGEEIGDSPLPGPHYVEPGTYQVTAAKGDLSATREVNVGAGQSADMELSVGEASVSQPPPAGDRSREDSVDATGGADPALDSRSGRKGFGAWFLETPLAWVGAGLAAGGLTASAVFAVNAKNRYDAADMTAGQIFAVFQEDSAAGRIPEGASACGPPVDQNPQYAGQPRGYSTACAQYVDQNAEGDSLKRWSIITFVLGGSAAGGTVLYYFLDPNAKASATRSSEQASARGSGVRILPIAGGDTYGVSIDGRF